eukprot:10704265-Heterocapsa_arctica.AAC.1
MVKRVPMDMFQCSGYDADERCVHIVDIDVDQEEQVEHLPAVALSAPVCTIVVPGPDHLHVVDLAYHVGCEVVVVVHHIADQRIHAIYCIERW